jgi:hypothetical protein
VSQSSESKFSNPSGQTGRSGLQQGGALARGGGRRRTLARWLALGLGAGVGGALVGRQAAQQVAADNGQNVIAGQTVTATISTQITGSVAAAAAFRATNGGASPTDNIPDGILI